MLDIIIRAAIKEYARLFRFPKWLRTPAYEWIKQITE